MAESESHRRARLERARRRRRKGAGAAIAVLVLAGVILGIGAWRARDDDSAPEAAIASSTTNSTAPTPDKLKTIVGKAPPRALSHSEPLRLWVGGDSLAGELGPSLGNQLAPTGIVKTTVDFKVGSGLHDNGLRNWPVRAADQMGAYSPDVAVYMIGANDTSIVGGSEDSWAPRYRDKVAAMMDLLNGPDDKRTVYWIGPPTMGPNSLDRGAKKISELMADEAKHHKNVVYVDAYTMFSGPDGGYTSRLDMPALDKTSVLVRISDGVHFTNNGAEWIAYNVGKLLDEQWQITKQSGGKALSVTVQSGGGSIPGGYRPTYKPRRSTTSAAPVTAAPSSTVGSVPQTTVGATTPPTSPRTTVSRPATTAPHNTTSPPTT